MAEQHSVDLGFAEKFLKNINSSTLLYPSKLGGKPGWLSFNNLPTSRKITCGNCTETLVFLCQIYAPVTIKDDHFHRIIYVFCCKNGPCSKTLNFLKAYRALKLESEEDLSANSPDELVKEKTCKLLNQLNLCDLCGIFGDKKCSLCSDIAYCCKQHQTIDWKSHKQLCKRKDEKQVKEIARNYLFKEYEIVIEQEPCEEKEDSFAYEEKKYEEYLGKTNTGNNNMMSDTESKKIKETPTDDVFLTFKQRIEREPEQVIRYDLGGEPLWVSQENVPQANDIPSCSCGAKRQFEIQILPQMLNYLGVETTADSLDWGTLCVYTCVDNCSPDQYIEEFVWKQDFSNIDVTA